MIGDMWFLALSVIVGVLIAQAAPRWVAALGAFLALNLCWWLFDRLR